MNYIFIWCLCLLCLIYQGKACDNCLNVKKIYMTFNAAQIHGDSLAIIWDACESKYVDIMLGNVVLFHNFHQLPGVNTYIEPNFYGKGGSTRVSAKETRKLFYELTGFWMPLQSQLLNPPQISRGISIVTQEYKGVQRNRFNVGSKISEGRMFFTTENKVYNLIQFKGIIDLNGTSAVVNYNDLTSPVPALPTSPIYISSPSPCSKYGLCTYATYESVAAPVNLESGNAIFLFIFTDIDGSKSLYYPRTLVHL